MKRQRKLSTVAKEIVVNKDTRKAKKYFNVCLNLLEMYSQYNILEFAYLLFNMCVDSMQGRYKMQSQTVMMVLAVVIYIVAPVDFIPDCLPFIGQLDDLSLLVYVINSCSDEINKYAIYRQGLAM